MYCIVLFLKITCLTFCGRLNAGLKHSIDDSHHKSALYAQAKADKRMNQTFPPAKSNAISALVYQRKESYSFGGWSDTPVSNSGLAVILMNGQFKYTCMKVVGFSFYSQREWRIFATLTTPV